MRSNLILRVPFINGGEELLLLIGSQKRFLSFFSLRMQFAIVDNKLAKKPDCFFLFVQTAYHIEMF